MDDMAPGETKPRDSEKTRKLHQRAMERFRATVEPQIEQRAQALQARRFVSIPGAQWEGAWGEQFEKSIRVEVNKTLRGVRKIESDYRANRIVPDFRPAGGDSNNETADLLDGLWRADNYHFKAQQGRDNAVLEAIKGGFGAYRLCTDWADPYDPDSDAQRVNPAMTIVDADQSVFFDGNSKLYDKSDARFAFVLTSMTVPAFKEDYGEERLATWDDGIPREQRWFDWYTPDMIRVCEYYETEDRSETLWVFTNALTSEEMRLFDSEIEEEARNDLTAQGWTAISRKVKRRRVHKYVLSGSEVLRDGGIISGGNIPIVPVYGVREYIDNQERFKGHVQDKMDSQRIYNAKVSKMMETDALAPREVPVFFPEQVKGHENTWADGNINRSPYQLINPMYDDNGQLIASGPAYKIEPPQLHPVTAALVQIASADLVEDDADGADEVKANTSAEAMDIAATRVDAKSGIYLDNIRQSIQREGEIYLDIAREVYWEPGRKVETMTEEGDDGEAELSQMVTDPKTSVTKIINDLATGKYKVIADVQEANSTKRDKSAKRLIEIGTALAASDPGEAAIAYKVAVLNLDGEGISDYQAFVRRGLVAAGVMEPTDDERAEMEKQAEQQQQPDPMMQLQMMLAQAEATLKQAQAGKAVEETQLVAAKRILTLAQAMAVGGPEQAPEVPSGFENDATAAEAEKNRAEARWMHTEADLMPEKLELERQKIVQRPRIKTGRELVH